MTATNGKVTSTDQMPPVFPSSSLPVGGGGILALFTNLSLTYSTISGNAGYGIFVPGTNNQSGAVINDCTISSNYLGILATATTGLSVLFSTISNNTGSPKWGGIQAGTATLFNSIVAGNSKGPDGSEMSLSSDVHVTNTITSTVGLNFGPLQNNGGPTQTMLPGPGSTAINAVQCPASTPSTPRDQRGYPRPDPLDAGLQTACDIGAVEVQPPLDRIFSNGFE